MPFPDLSGVVREVWNAFMNNIYWIIVFAVLAALFLKTLTDERKDWRGLAFSVMGIIVLSAMIYNLPALAEWLNSVAQGGGGGGGGAPRP